MKIDLLIVDRRGGQGASDQTCFGGAPSVPAGFAWPACKVCGGNMQFLGQIRRHRPERLLSLFMCQNRPGVCLEWEANRGANKVICMGVDGLTTASLPGKGDVSRPTRYGARVEAAEAENYEAERATWEKAGKRLRDVLGQIDGAPVWLDSDETPACDHCARPMRFVAQLEAGPDRDTEMNFGGRCGYAFECDCHGGVGKLLW
ncbi:hypothetical protein [Plastoroseomonas hellenica]|uniref:hypothetical protein n=1 Tax=Plastoroseomonas hellenica TaxID=2687306 RepID=UPI001BAAD314|nr:hypothetical protein [Plastoroseomonas hellenica]MBR0647214.1 DUF1963 domain-containing protein [Plastoroseomonas hellenica]